MQLISILMKPTKYRQLILSLLWWFSIEPSLNVLNNCLLGFLVFGSKPREGERESQFLDSFWNFIWNEWVTLEKAFWNVDYVCLKVHDKVVCKNNCMELIGKLRRLHRNSSPQFGTGFLGSTDSVQCLLTASQSIAGTAKECTSALLLNHILSRQWAAVQQLADRVERTFLFTENWCHWM